MAPAEIESTNELVHSNEHAPAEGDALCCPAALTALLAKATEHFKTQEDRQPTACTAILMSKPETTLHRATLKIK
eukprot:1158310-Pelagomonas_calceolata.AAC.1